MYIIKIGTDQYQPEIKAIVETIGECFQIYWNYHNSVQSVNSKFYVQTTCLNTFSHFDITKGAFTSKTCSSDFIECTKNHDYIVDRANAIMK